MPVKNTPTLKVHLEKEQETLLITLYAKALDSLSKPSILEDNKAEELFKRIDYDFDKVNHFGNHFIVTRAKHLDIWLNKFLEENVDGIILNLGCGLDTRISRISPLPNVRWFDVDYPEVIKLRKNFYSNCEGYEMIESSVNDIDWLEKIPNDKPVMILAEGVLEYLTENEVNALFERITNYFPKGQIAFDVMNEFAVKSGNESLKETTGAEHRWAVDDLHNVDKLNPMFKRVAKLSIIRSKYIRLLPLKYRLMYALMGLFPNFRHMIRVLLYKF